MEKKEFDPVWNDLYTKGLQINKYPFDSIVSTLIRLKPVLKNKNPKLLEIGCAAGNNLIFAAKEGFSVYGLDASKVALKVAKTFFAENSYVGNFYVGSFSELPFKNDFFDVVIERAALQHSPFNVAKKAVKEVRRVLKQDGYFYSEIASSKSKGKYQILENYIEKALSGPFEGVGQTFFYSDEKHSELFSEFSVIEKSHIEKNFNVGEWEGLSECKWSTLCQK